MQNGATKGKNVPMLEGALRCGVGVDGGMGIQTKSLFLFADNFGLDRRIEMINAVTPAELGMITRHGLIAQYNIVIQSAAYSDHRLT